MSTTAIEQSIPTGTWTVDPIHSTVGFAVRHMGAALFRGSFQEFTATLQDGTLRGTAKVPSVQVQDENLSGHLLSPDFFDAERFPEIAFEAASLQRDGEDLVVEGELELRGVRKPVELRGTIVGPSTDPYGNERLGISLETTINRFDFGVSFDADLPNGGKVVANEVKLSADLELVKEA
jgi:polyisoprenoid-binding protein YceI